MKRIHIDTESNLVAARFAVVYAPQKKRGRFPENCVEVFATAEEAIHQADSSSRRYPAKVVGPSKSSEGVRLYYLDCWLDDEQIDEQITK